MKRTGEGEEERKREREREKEATCAGTQAHKCVDSTPDNAVALGMSGFWIRQVIKRMTGNDDMREHEERFTTFW